ncbi:hypothetical protein [Flavobacterium columnare]|uniref:hypothetical protein n=1 Tax=Flavobacterium columnare TaxID=996 RepID=UPI0013E34AA5|nr:hypothetical protein [Flavobacterium columnare]MCH4830608.1 hypothetical protein [Flavobacterium columnare]
MCSCPECLEEFDAKQNIVEEEEIRQNRTYKKGVTATKAIHIKKVESDISDTFKKKTAN